MYPSQLGSGFLGKKYGLSIFEIVPFYIGKAGMDREKEEVRIF